MGKLFEELKRRKVFRVVVAYAVVAWVLIQISSEVLPALQMPEWTVSFVTVLLLLGFPVALLLGWAFELTPEGVKADTGVQAAPAASNNTDRILIYAILAIVVLGAGFQVADSFIFEQQDNVVASNDSVSTTPSSARVVRSTINLGNMQYRELENVTTNFDFSPDGSQLVYSSYVNGNYRLQARNLAELESQTIFQSNTLSVFSPRVSPDGQKVLFLTADSQLYTLQLNGSTTPALLAENASHEAYAWIDNENVAEGHR